MLEFSAIVQAAGRGGHVLPLPDNIAAAFGARHMQRVNGTLGGVDYRSNLIESGGRFYLGVHKATLQAAGKDTGDAVTVTLEEDTAPR